MMVFWFFSSLAYLLFCLVLAGYSLLGLCVRPLAATRDYVAGNLLLVYLLLLSTVVSGAFYGCAVVHVLGRHGWKVVTDWTDLRTILGILAVVVLPFCLCRREIRRPLGGFLIAVGGFVAQTLLFLDAATSG